MGLAVQVVDPGVEFFDIVKQTVDRDKVTLKMTNLGYGSVWIDLLQVDEGHEGLGLGARVLDALCALADEVGVSLLLKAITIRPWIVSQDKLEGFYARRGFQVVRLDAGLMPTMERHPA